MTSAPTISGLDCGWMRTQRRSLIDGAGTNEIDIPIISWLVRHPAGDVVFDVGLAPELAHGTESLGRLAKIFAVDLDVGGTIGPRLQAHDVDPASNLTVVLSHGHFDHCGGLVELPNARVLVQADEWAATNEGGGGYDPSLVGHGHDVVELNGDHDVFGDGTVRCVPTPGHTCGHQSLRIETSDGVVVLAGDACYFDHTLDDEQLPPFAYDHEAQLRSLRQLQAERAAGVRVIPGHDGDVFRAFG